MEKPHDEFFEAEVERALRPYRGLVGDRGIEALEATVRDLLENDPIAAELLAAARPRPRPLQTGAEPTAGHPAPPSKKPADEG